MKHVLYFASLDSPILSKCPLSCLLLTALTNIHNVSNNFPVKAYELKTIAMGIKKDIDNNKTVTSATTTTLVSQR